MSGYHDGLGISEERWEKCVDVIADMDDSTKQFPNEFWQASESTQKAILEYGVKCYVTEHLTDPEFVDTVLAKAKAKASDTSSSTA